MKVKMMPEKYSSTAKVIDGVLILSLPDAVSPVVWQMELGQSKSSALEIRNSDNGQFVLTLKTPRQDVIDIATYANRDLAIKALLVTSSALEKAQGQLRSSANENSHPNYPLPVVTRSASGAFHIMKKILLWLSAIAAGILLLGFVLFLISSALNVFMSATSGNSAAPQATSGGSDPVSADDFFENR